MSRVNETETELQRLLRDVESQLPRQRKTVAQLENLRGRLRLAIAACGEYEPNDSERLQ